MDNGVTLGYYAQQIGRSFRNVDYRNLYDVFLAKYGDEFKTLKELKIVKPDPKIQWVLNVMKCPSSNKRLS